MTDPSNALLLSSRCFELLLWNAEDDLIMSGARVPALVALREDESAALGEAAEQWFALDRMEIVPDLLNWLSGRSQPPDAFANSRAETWCAALLRQLRDNAVAAGFLEPSAPCVLLLPDALIPQAQRLVAAAEVAGLTIDGWVPVSLAAAHAAPRRPGATQLLCVADDLAVTLALIGEADGPKLAQCTLEMSLGSAARSAAVVAVIEDALHNDGVEVRDRMRARIQLAARSLHEPLFGRAVAAALEIDTGSQVRQVCISPAEVERRLARSWTSCVRSVREMVRQLPDLAPSVLVVGESHDVRWVRRLLTEAIPSASFEVLRAEGLVIGGLKARRAAANVAPATAASADEVTALVGLVGESAAGHPKFDILFDPRDPRERAIVRTLSFPDEVRIALFRPDGDGRFEPMGEVHFPAFDYLRRELEVRFSRAASHSYHIQCYDRVSGRVENKMLPVTHIERDKALRAALATLKIIPPLPAGWPQPAGRF